MSAPQSEFAHLLPELIVLIGVISNGLLAGVFFAFSCAVTPGLRRVDDRSYVRTVRAVNSAILNGWFLSVFLIAPLAAVGSALAPFIIADSEPSTLLVIGVICSVLTFAITAAVNVPLNRGLDEAPIEAAEAQRAARNVFETRWNRWNLMRTLSSIAAFVVLLVTLVA